MFAKHFYHSTTRNLVVAFGDFFNDMFVVKFKADGTEAFRQKVPIEYAPKNKWYRVLKQRENEFKSVANNLPRFSFEILSMNYDSNRNMQLVNPMLADGHRTLSPVPYNYDINLYASVANSDEGFQLMEQIVPFFKPTFNLTAKIIPELGYEEDVPLTLKSVSKEDEYEGDFEAIRFQTWTFSFEAEMNVWNRVSESKLIRKAITDIHSVDGSGKITSEEISETPSHITITTALNPLNAEPEDDYGFSISIEEDI